MWKYYQRGLKSREEEVPDLYHFPSQMEQPVDQILADFFLINMNRIERVGAQYDPKSVLVTVGLKGSMDYTVVNGAVVVKEGQLVNVEEKLLAEKANEKVEQYLNH